MSASEPKKKRSYKLLKIRPKKIKVKVCATCGDECVVGGNITRMATRCDSCREERTEFRKQIREQDRIKREQKAAKDLEVVTQPEPKMRICTECFLERVVVIEISKFGSVCFVCKQRNSFLSKERKKVANRLIHAPAQAARKRAAKLAS